MKKILLLAFYCIICIGVCAQNVTSIPGKVKEVKDREVTITYKGDLIPNVGDSVFIGIEIDGEFIPYDVAWIIMDVGSGSIKAINMDPEIITPSLGYEAIVKSKNPRHQNYSDIYTSMKKNSKSGNVNFDIPRLQANVDTIKFFETGKDVTKKNLRKYQNTFVSSETRYINYELNISYPSPRKRMDFDIVAKWYGPDGNEYAKYSKSSHIDSNWNSSNHSDGWGTKEGGYWKPGKYRLELYIGNKKVGAQSIEVIDAHYFYAGAYQIPEISGSFGDVRFYEGGTSGVSKKERQYASDFSKSSTRYIFWEVNLLHDQFEKQFDIDIEAIFLKSDGETFGSHVLKTQIPSGKSSSIHSRGLGWNEFGKWPPGNYRVVFKVAGNSVGTEYFTIK